MSKFTVLIGVDTETDVGSFTPFYESIPKCVPILLDIFDEKQLQLVLNLFNSKMVYIFK